eukprot:365820-Pleurochrysis_carterae.AAC.1
MVSQPSDNKSALQPLSGLSALAESVRLWLAVRCGRRDGGNGDCCAGMVFGAAVWYAMLLAVVARSTPSGWSQRLSPLSMRGVCAKRHGPASQMTE